MARRIPEPRGHSFLTVEPERLLDISVNLVPEKAAFLGEYF